jgi:hypothetical protein
LLTVIGKKHPLGAIKKWIQHHAGWQLRITGHCDYDFKAQTKMPQMQETGNQGR